ncbi:MAG TPA: hypothetical protein VGJ44_27110 [Kribbellaceae bacterium]
MPRVQSGCCASYDELVTVHAAAFGARGVPGRPDPPVTSAGGRPP